MAEQGNPLGLTDTDVLIDGARRVPQAVEFLAAQMASGFLQISVISAMEMIAGCQNWKELEQLQRFMEPIRVLSLTEPISTRAHHLVEECHLSHGLGIPDALIAATALEHGIRLYTRNTRHFQMIPGLAIEKPY